MIDQTIKIDTLELFKPLYESLFELLDSLDSEEWLQASPIPDRTVKDLLAHLLDGTLRRLSYQRDGFQDQSLVLQIHSYNDLVQHIQKLNSDWMSSTRRLSPQILSDLLKYSEPQLADFFMTLDPFDPSPFSVAWAGEEVSSNWFDIAREFTEKWHHQMQIRLALKRPLLIEPKYITPFYQTCFLGLPHTLTKVADVKEGTKVKVSISGSIQLHRVCLFENGEWRSLEGIALENCLQDQSISYQAEISLPDTIAWILFTNTDRNKDKFTGQIEKRGSSALVNAVMSMVNVMS